MRAIRIVVHPPGFDDRLRLGERDELVHVQAFGPQSPVKRLNEGIFHGFARPKVELDAAAIGLIFQGAGLEFRPMIDRDGTRARTCPAHTIEQLTHDLARHPKPCL